MEEGPDMEEPDTEDDEDDYYSESEDESLYDSETDEEPEPYEE